MTVKRASMRTERGKVGVPSVDLYRLCTIMVDMQPLFLEEVVGNESSMLITSHEKLLEICIEEDYPLIALEYHGKGRTTKRLREIIQEVRRHIFIQKDSDDGFASGTLENLLRKWDVKFLLITGINAAFCVKETAEGAVLRGMDIITARQLISDRRYQSIRYAKRWFEENGTYFQDYEILLQTMRSKKEGLDKNLASKSRDTFPLMNQMSRIIKKAASYLPQYTV